MATPKPDSQAGLLLTALKAGPVCSFEFYYRPGFTHRIAARIYDLRRQGHTIETQTCARHLHDAKAVEYVLA